MTKEEALNKFIERYKSYVNKRFVNLVDCCGMDCENCPFRGDQCVDDVVMAIIDHFGKAEEKKETNLEHYIIRDKGVAVNFHNEDEAWRLIFKVGADEAYGQFDNYLTPIDWLLSPYEPPKYKLSKFEHDLLKCYHVSIYGIKDFWILEQMQDKGYFKDIPNDAQIRDIIDNCEVVDE